jgi:hypothetical protein
MYKYILLTFLLLPFTLLAQDDETTTEYEPAFEVPGEVVVDFGWNFLRDNENLDVGFWGSKSISLYYLYEYPNERTHFTVNVGLGVGLEKYDFEDSYTLENVRENGQTQTNRVELDSAFNASVFMFDDIRKSKLAANYVEIPLEFRWYQFKSDHKRGFRISAGIKGGILFSSHTKIVYEEQGDRLKRKVKDDFNLNRFRWSLSGRIGWGPASVFYEHGMSSLFDGVKGPGGVQPTYWKIGVSLVGF